MMLIICPHCKKQHNIDEKRIPPNVKIARCQGCGQQFPLELKKKELIRPESAAPQVARIIGVSLSKGGVGKTTTAANLAAGLALSGHKTLLVDTDTQGQAAFMLGIKAEAGLTELITEELSPEESIMPARKNLWLLAGGKSLAGLKRVIDRKDFGGELTLAHALKPLASQYDYIIVDSSPGWDPLTVNVLFYVTELLAPVSLEIMSVQGFSEFLKSIASIQKYRPEIVLRYVLPTFQDKRVKKSGIFLEYIQKLYGDKVCSPIRYNVRLSEAPGYGQTIYEFAPGSNGAKDYRELVRKITGNSKLFT